MIAGGVSTKGRGERQAATSVEEKSDPDLKLFFPAFNCLASQVSDFLSEFSNLRFPCLSSRPPSSPRTMWKGRSRGQQQRVEASVAGEAAASLVQL